MTNVWVMDLPTNKEKRDVQEHPFFALIWEKRNGDNIKFIYIICPRFFGALLHMPKENTVGNAAIDQLCILHVCKRSGIGIYTLLDH